METDKTGQLAVATMEAYIEMGQVHVSKDKEIDQSEVDERERLLNGHVSMLLKITDMGSHWNHEDRHRESNIKHSGYVAFLTLLLKNHKDPVDGKWSTRPVVSANEGIGTSLSNILSEVLEPLADSLEDKIEVISTEDMLYRVNECNKLLQAEWTQEDQVGCIGADVRMLFPQLTSRNTGRIIREQFVKSKLELENVDYGSAAMYVRYGMEDYEIRALGLSRVVPRRRYTRGRAPGITSSQALGGDPDNAEEKWIFPDIELSDYEKRALVGACLEIGVRTSFENSVYQFAGRYYLQSSGGGTGARVTMCSARIIMADWGQKMTEILKRNNIKTWLKSAYVDDVRFVINLLRMNQKWDDTSKSFIETQTKIDEISPIRHSANEMKLAMESINPDLKFVMELEEDFKEDHKLPTLDTSWYFLRPENAAPSLEFEFFEKRTNSKFCILEKSAMDYRAKFAILSNEVIRRCLTTKETVPQERKDEIMDEFSLKLLRSGYSITQARQILVAGLRGYLNKVQLAAKNGWDLHRSAESSLASRVKKKTLEKQNWFRSKKKNGHNLTSNPKHKRCKDAKAPLRIKSVLFVARTGSTELCKRLRAAEQNLSRMTGYGVKLQERSGTQIRKILCNGKSAWSEVKCLRPWCMVCLGGQGQCRRRNQTYISICNVCEERKNAAEAGVKEEDDTKEDNEVKEDNLVVWRYGGETSRSLAERSRDHFQGFLNKSPENHLWKHKILCHPEEEITFSMKSDRKHFSSFERMCRETILIESLEEQGGILNLKISGYNRCTIPRLQVVMGDKVHDEKENNEASTVDVDTIFQEHSKRSRKKARYKESDAETKTHDPLPPPKRRKVKVKPKCTNGSQPNVSDKDSFKNEGMPGSAQRLDEQKQVDMDSDNSSSLPSNSNLFSIFNKSNLKAKNSEHEQGKKRSSRTVKKLPPDFKYKKISDHFRPQ